MVDHVIKHTKVSTIPDGPDTDLIRPSDWNDDHVIDIDTSDVPDTANKRYVTDAEKTKLTNLSGTNTGDQTSIVGITGTKAQFDTAVTDGNFAYQSDLASYVPTTTTVNGHALSSNVTVTKSDVGLSNVPNTDATNPANISQTASYRFVTDTEKTTWNGKQNALGFTPENVANKATDFSVINNTKYPTTQAVANYVAQNTLDTGALNYRTAYDIAANTPNYPSTGGSGLAGAVEKGDFWIASTAGLLGSLQTAVNDLIIADIDNPGQTAANWSVIRSEFGYTPEDQANKNDDDTFATPSSTEYPTTSAVKTALDRKMDINGAVCLYVDNQNPNAYQKISDAIADVGVSNSSNPWHIKVAPGVYPLETLTIPDYVRIEGSGINSTIIDNAGQTANTFISGGTSEIAHLSIWNVDPGYYAIYNEDTTFTTVHKVSFYNCDKVLGVFNNTAAVVDVYFEYCDADAGLDTVVTCESTNGNPAIASFENTYFYTDPVLPYAGIQVTATGPGSNVLFVGSTLWGSGSDTGIDLSDGARLDMQSTIIRDTATGIKTNSGGADAVLLMSGVNYANNTIDLDISDTTTGSTNTISPYDKTIIDPASTFFIVGKDPKIITVAKKGGDFTSIKDACVAITDSSINNLYIVKVGPGIYTEDQIDLTSKPYVSITADQITTTIVTPSANTFHQFLIGVGCELSFIRLDGHASGYGTGYAGIACIDSGDYSQAHKVQFNDWDIGVLITSSDILTKTVIYLEYVDFNGEYTHGIKAVSTGTGEVFCSGENLWNLPTSATAPTMGAHVEGPGTTVSFGSGTHIGYEASVVTGSTGILVKNGAQLTASSYFIEDTDIAIHNPNVGSAVSINMLGVELKENNQDILIEHATTTGFLQGTATHAKVFKPSTSSFGWTFYDDVDGHIEITNTLSVTQPQGTHTEILQLIKNGQLGLYAGGIITPGTGMSIDVSNAYGYLINGVTEIQKISFEDEANGEAVTDLDSIPGPVTFTAETEYYVYVNQDGNIVANTAYPAANTTILLGRIFTNTAGDGIEFIDQVRSLADNTSASFDDIYAEVNGPQFVSGCIVENGATNQEITATTGKYWVGSNSFSPSGDNTALTFTVIYRNGLAGDWVFDPSETLVPNDVYDNAGTLVTLPTGKHVKHSLYVVGQGSNEKWYLVVAQEYHNSLVNAESGDLPAPPSWFTGGIVRVAGLCIGEGDTSVATILSIRPLPLTQAPASAAVTSHTALTDLTTGNAGHTQFLMLNGSTPMQADLDMDTWDIDLTGGGNILGWIGSTSLTTLGTVTTGTWNGSVIDEVRGGTNQSSYTLGDTLYASASNTLSKLAGNTTTTKKFLIQTGTGVASAAPVWDTIVAGDIPTLNQNTTGSAASLSISGQTGLLTVTGLTSTNRIKTVRDAADTLLELGGSYTPSGTWTSLTMVTPVLGTPTSGNLTNCTFPTLNQDTTGTAAKADALKISGQTGLLTFTGLTSTNRVKTVRDAADTILELGGSYTPTGTWTSLTLVTPVLGTPASGNLANCTFPTLNQNTTGTASKATNIVGGNNTTLLGSLPYQSNTDVTTLLSPNTTTTIKVLTQTGDGTNGAAPVWNSLAALGIRSGRVTSFSGNPKKATVTFSSTLGTTDYSIGITGDVSRTWTYESKTATGFVINSNANTAISGEVSWQAILDI